MSIVSENKKILVEKDTVGLFVSLPLIGKKSDNKIKQIK